MKKSIFKKSFLAILSLSLVIPSSSVVADSIPDEQAAARSLMAASLVEISKLLNKYKEE